MGRSLIATLRRRFGTRASGAERAQRAAAYRTQTATDLPIDLLTALTPSAPRAPVRVAVVGGGFAGLSAARVLQNLQAEVTLFEARPVYGGRVQTAANFIGNRLLERGAELIGVNHPCWLTLTRDLGLGLSVITEDDQFEGQRLSTPLRFLGRRLTPTEARDLSRQLDRAADDLAHRAGVITDPFNPWLAPTAPQLDSTTLESWIHGFTRDPLLRAALEFEFSNDNAVATRSQSLLAVLTQIAGGGGRRYWEDTEVFRCSDGNAALAARLVSRLDGGHGRRPVIFRQPEAVHEINPAGTHVVVTSTDQRTQQRRTTEHDYAIIAVPTTVWPSLTLGGRPIPIPPVQNGPAVKYLAEVRSRYWIRQGDAPSGAADDMGGLWEGTDNQMGSSGIDLTVFAGGPAAMAVGTSPSAHFDPKLEALLPGYHNDRVRSDFANWPAEPFIRTGYSCPAPRQVMTSVLWMQQAMAGRIFFAGEHASPQFFGYMEGALRSGVAAAARILAVSSLQAPASTSGLSGRGVALHLPAVAHH